jgi:hypothetical protein
VAAAHVTLHRSMNPSARLTLGKYLGSISYPDGIQLEELDVLVDPNGDLEVMWLALPGKPSHIAAAEGTYTVAFEDGTTLRLQASDSLVREPYPIS